MDYRKPLSALALLCVLSSVVPAHASGLIDATDPNRILEIAKGFGSAELSRDSSGDPMITGRIEGVKYGVFFYGCNKGRDCDDIQFAASWAKPGVSLDRINEWNKTRRYGTASLDKDGDPQLRMSVNIDYGVSKRNLEDSFNWWKVALRDFVKEFIDR